MSAENYDADPLPIAERQPEPQQAGSMLPVIQQAIAQGMDPAKLEKMLDVHERWTKARAEEKFGASLAAFQAECPQIQKGRKTQGGTFNFTYASLDDVMKVAQPIMARHGISALFDSTHQTNEKGPAVINVTVRVRVGSYFEDRKFGCPIPTDLKASQPQQWGAALSYAKRYALCAALNIVVTDEDNDAANVIDTISGSQMIELETLIAEKKVDITKFLAWAEIETLDRMPLTVFPKAVDMLKRKAVVK